MKKQEATWELTSTFTLQYFTQPILTISILFQSSRIETIPLSNTSLEVLWESSEGRKKHKLIHNQFCLTTMCVESLPPSPPNIRRKGPRTKQPVKFSLLAWLFLIALCTVSSTWFLFQDIVARNAMTQKQQHQQEMNPRYVRRSLKSQQKDNSFGTDDYRNQTDILNNHTQTAIPQMLSSTSTFERALQEPLGLQRLNETIEQSY